MTTTQLTAPAARLRASAFRVVCVLVALAVSPSAVSVLTPMTDVSLTGISHPERVRWSLGLEGAIDLLLVVLLLAAALRPALAPNVVRLISATALAFAVLVLPVAGPTALAVLVMLLLVVAAYPHPSELVEMRRARGTNPQLAVGVLAAGVLLPLAGALAHRQWQLPHGSDASLNVLATDAEHLVTLAVAGLLCSVAAPGRTLLTAAVGVAWVYLGIVSVALPSDPQSWGVLGGAAALSVGAVFLGAAVRRDTTAS